MNISDIIDKELKKYKDGKQFFEALNKAFMTEDILLEMWEYLSRNIGVYPYIVMQGDFGRFLFNVLQPRRAATILIKSNIRDGEKVDDLSECSPGIRDKPFLFIDDNVYSGRTRTAIDKELKRHGAYIAQTFVIYDGSTKPKHPEIDSIYRYHPDGGYKPPKEDKNK